MKYKVKIKQVETYEREFIVEANNADEARKNAEKAIEQDYPNGYYQDLLTEDVKDYKTTYTSKGKATEKDIKILAELEYDN